MNGDFISVGEALQEISRRFWHSLGMQILHSGQEAILYKLMLTHTGGEPRTAISHRSLNNWTELRVSAKHLYRKMNPRLPCESIL